MASLTNNINDSIVNNWSYKNQIILAPMVRVCTLPFRLLALKVLFYISFILILFYSTVLQWYTQKS